MIEDIKKTLWATADKLRANMDAAEYKHLVLGLIFVKYISDIRCSEAEVPAEEREIHGMGSQMLPMIKGLGI